MERNTKTIIVRVTDFASIIIVVFDLAITEVSDIIVGVFHAGFFTKVVLWLKTHLDPNG
jgi:hypothetical protein